MSRLLGRPPVLDVRRARPAPRDGSTEGLGLTGRGVRDAVCLYSPGWLLTRVTTTDTERGDHRLLHSPFLAFGACHRAPDSIGLPRRSP
ncbi:hypothetical protein [Streptomyces sp. NPDC059247]|uniref:hypothetical protein n=1 Tax=Streptomyces sp. NPDC059247 TaxID=3346790 RepID=UPI00367F266E